MKNLYVIDAYNLIYRMFYAIPEMHTRNGEQVNAIYGVAKFLRQLTDLGEGDQIIVASESGSNFRETLYTEYKGTRDRMPDNLRSQIEGVFECFDVFGIPVIVREGYEADDVIGTLATLHSDPESEIVIVSSDKDLCQFVLDGRVRIYDAMKQKNLRRTDVIEKFGVLPEQVRDYLAIVGDSSDNIPGIAGFGPKKAEDLLRKYDTLEGIYRELGVMNYELGQEINIDREKYDACELSDKLKQGLIDSISNAFLSQKLASIVIDLDIDCTPKDLRREMFIDPLVLIFLKKYEFRSLLPKDHVEEHKSLEKGTIIEVNDMKILDNLLESVRKDKKILIATSKEGKIVIGIGANTYSIDTTRVDVRDFVYDLLALDIEIVGYDAKEDLKYLMRLEKPLQGVEGQGRLF